jgi:hypothetical protein
MSLLVIFCKCFALVLPQPNDFPVCPLSDSTLPLQLPQMYAADPANPFNLFQRGHQNALETHHMVR